MTDPSQRRTLAEAEAIVARQRVTRTLSQLQQRLNPRRLVREAVDEAKDAGAAAAQTGIGAARRHPGAIAGTAALLTLFAVRRPLGGLLRRATRQDRKS